MTNLVPPHNDEAERAVLGAMILFPDTIPDVMEKLESHDFYKPSHQTIYKSIERLVSSGEPVDLLTLASELERIDVINRVGGRSYLLEIGESMPVLRNVSRYCEIVKESAKLRKMVEVGHSVMIAGYNGDPESIDTVLSDAASEIVSLSLNSISDEAPHASQVLRELIGYINNDTRTFITPPGIHSGRCEPGDLVVVAAGTSVGKTALSLLWAEEWAKSKRVVYYEYEMPERNLLARLVCRYAGVPMSRIQDGETTEEERMRIEDAAKVLSTRNLKVQEVWCNVGTLCAKIRKEAMQGAEIVFIDHLGLIPFDIPRGMNYAKAVGRQVTNYLKRLASELNIIIVLLVQLNREGQHNPAAFPRLIHLRDSGEIEQDAAVVFTIWSDRSLRGDEHRARKIQVREACGFLSDDEVYSAEFDLVRIGIEKNRNGPLSDKFVLFHGDRFDFEDRDVSVSLYREPEQTTICVFDEELDNEVEGVV